MPYTPLLTYGQSVDGIAVTTPRGFFICLFANPILTFSQRFNTL